MRSHRSILRTSLAAVIILSVAVLAHADSAVPLLVTLRADKKLPLLIVNVRNRSNTPSKCSSVFYLEKPSETELRFWSPVDLERRKPLTVNQHAQFTVSGHDDRTFVMPFTALRWSKTISAVWPASTFKNLNERGSFTLALELSCESARYLSNSLLAVSDHDGHVRLSPPSNSQ